MNWKAALALLLYHPVVWLAVVGWAVFIGKNSYWIAGAIASAVMIVAIDRLLDDRLPEERRGEKDCEAKPRKYRS